MKKYIGKLTLLLAIGVLLASTGLLSSSASSAGQRPRNQPAERRTANQFTPAATTFVVNSTADGDDVLLGDGICQTEAGGCTLRAAIQESNALAGLDVINFQIGGGGQQTITLTELLPQITESVIIDGTTQTGFSGTPIINVSGGGMVSALFVLQASDSTIRGLVLNQSDDAIVIFGNNNKIFGNYIGTDFSGSAGPGNTGRGLLITLFASGNKVGGLNTGEPNVIAFNDIGIFLLSQNGGNSFLSNSIFNNADLGIKISEDIGPLPNDTCDSDVGPNEFQNYPDLTSASASIGSVTIQGTLNSESGQLYRIEFFANAQCDDSGFGEGQTFIGSTSVTTNPACIGTFNVTLPASVAGGQLITATATDPSGSTSEFSECQLVTSANCVLTCPNNIVTGNDPNQCGAVVNYSLPTTSGPCGPVMCSRPPGSFFFVGTTNVFCSDGSPGPVGLGGNTCSFSVTVNDNEGPVFSGCNNVTASASSNACSAVVNYTTPTANDQCDEARPVTCNPPSGSSFSKGATTVTCSASDTSGNTRTCSFTVTVPDSVGPVLSGCNNVVATTAPNSCTAIVNYTTPTANDNCDGPRPVTCNPPSGSSFNKGVTNVTCSASDTNSPIPNTSTCTFTVTVTDGVPAVLRGCNNVTVNTDPNFCSATVSYPTPTVEDGCEGPRTVTCAPPSGSAFPIGTNIVTCTAGSPNNSPGAGVGSCAFSVLVIDNEPPRLDCPAPITVQPASGQQVRAVDYNLPTATDNCVLLSAPVCQPPSGTTFPLGTTRVNCFAVDRSGNSGGCSFTVTVADLTPPTITCPANVTATAPAGQCSGAAVIFPTPQIGGPANTTVLCLPPSGSTFPVGSTVVNCTAVTPAGTAVACAFSVTVSGSAQARVMLEGGGSTLDFGEAPATRRPESNPTSRTFMIENTGCAVLSLAHTSTLRTGSDVTSGRITNPDDRQTFPLTIVNPDGSERTVVCDTGSFCIRINPAQKVTFRVRFNRVIPPYAGKTNNLAATEVLPDLVTSQITFAQANGSPIVINLTGRVTPLVQLIHPKKAKKSARVNFSRDGNEYVVRFGFHDPNLNVTSVRYELLRSNGQVAETIDVDVADAVRSINPVRGQSLSLVQRFSGANDNPDITGVRVTLTDGEGSATLSSASFKAPGGAVSAASTNGARAATLSAHRAGIKP